MHDATKRFEIETLLKVGLPKTRVAEIAEVSLRTVHRDRAETGAHSAATQGRDAARLFSTAGSAAMAGRDAADRVELGYEASGRRPCRIRTWMSFKEIPACQPIPTADSEAALE